MLVHKRILLTDYFALVALITRLELAEHEVHILDVEPLTSVAECSTSYAYFT